MATVGKRKLKEISRVSVIHDVLEDELRDEAAFLEESPEHWSRQQKELYNLMIEHEDRLKNSILEILNR